MRFGVERRYLVVGLVLAITGAFAVRAFRIDHPALWIDEIFTLLYARQDLAHLLSLTRTSDIHPPLYYVIVKGVTALFDEGDGTALRLISASASALSAGLLFLFGQRRFGIGVAVIATLYFVLLPVNVHYGRELRTYAVLALALLSATVCFAEMLEAERASLARRYFAAGYVISLVLAFHLHYSAIVYFLLFSAAALALWVLDSNAARLRFALAATLAAGLLCLPQAFHFIWARSHVADDFWIDETSWRSFYGITLGAYPFPGWSKLVVYPAYLFGAWLLWRQDRRFAVIAFTFLVGGPALVALIGIVSPAYLVRTIQAFTVLSPFLLAVFVLALPRLAVLPAILALAAIHVLAIRADYPPQKEDLAIDRVVPIVAEVRPETIYYVAHLREQLDLRHVNVNGWVPVALNEPGTIDRVAARMERCAGHATCGPTVVVMERAPPFEIENGRIWMTGMDGLAARYGAVGDSDVSGMRVLVLP